MPAAKSKAAAPSGAAAAQAEKAKSERTIDFHGVELTLPPKLPNSFGLRLAQIAAATNEMEVAAGVYRLLVPKYVSTEKYEALLDVVDESEEAIGIESILQSVLEAYGLDSGESEASASS